MKRQQIVAGNWKMNNNFEQGRKLVREIVAKEQPKDALLILAPPFISLKETASLIEGTEWVKLAAQNCHQETKGAYTGEVSADMLVSVGVEYVILGHSERREYFGESDALLAKKVDTALANGLKVIFCCGENLDIRESGKHEEYVSAQIKAGVFHLSPEQFSNVVIAYEPIWAIGTGVTASSDQAQEMHKAIRALLTDKYGEEMAQATSLLYGGSCKPSNATELFANEDVDGGLIGGAALKADDFLGIAYSY